VALNRHRGLPQAADREVALRHGVSRGDVLRADVGLPRLGKRDFDALVNFRDDGFFAEALGIGTMPSAVTVRQRLGGAGGCVAAAGDPVCGGVPGGREGEGDGA
jgi:hypothetical protein